MNVERAVALQLQNDFDLREVVRTVLTNHKKAHPNSTSRVYERYQSAWTRWCLTREFLDSNAVSEGKLLLYLKEVVCRCGVESSMVLSKSGVENYVKAVVDLYKTQQSLGLNKYPHPRGKALKTLLNDQVLLANKRKRDNFEDRGNGL